MTDHNWTRDDILELRRLYDKAVAADAWKFNFQGNDVLVEHAAVLIERLPLTRKTK